MSTKRNATKASRRQKSGNNKKSAASESASRYASVSSRVRSVLKYAYGITHLNSFRSWLSSVAWGTLIGGPPLIIFNYYSGGQFGVALRQNWPTVAQWLDGNVLIWFFLASVWAGFLALVRKVLLNYISNQPEGWENIPAILLQVVNNIVGRKESRFNECLATHIDLNNRQRHPLSGELFRKITQPEMQISEIVQNVYHLFDLVARSGQTNDVAFKTSLALVKGNKVVSIMCYYPNDQRVRTPADAFNNPKSSMSNAIRSRKLIVVENFQREAHARKPQFLITDPSRQDESGSLLCFPVIYGPPLDTTVFVLSVSCNKPDYFRRCYTDTYEAVLKPFGLRLRLEFSLLALKEMAQDEQE